MDEERIREIIKEEQSSEITEEKIKEIIREENSSGKIDLQFLSGKFDTSAVVPSGTPTTPQRQIVIYINGATLRLYIYDYTNNNWRFASLT